MVLVAAPTTIRGVAARAWRWAHIGTALLALACGAQPAEAPRVGVSPRSVPTDLVLLARDRWEAASGIRLEIGPGLAPVEFDADLVDGALDCRTPDEIVQGRRERPCIGRTRLTHDELGRIRLMNMTIWSGARGDDCRTLNVLMHEWGHALRRDATGSHLDEPGFMLSAGQDPISQTCRQIDRASLELVCEAAPCTRLNPETSG
jgi:hypothetical protein